MAQRHLTLQKLLKIKSIAKDSSVNSSVAVEDGKLVHTIENYAAEGQLEFNHTTLR